MTRAVFVFAAAALFAAISVPPALAQQPTPATQKASTPPLPAKWVVPIKGKASVEIVPAQAKKVGDELVTTLKVKNTSTGPIALLKVDEYWYNKKREEVSAGTSSFRQPFMPNQVIDLTIKCPYKTDIDTNQFMFSHANGTIEPKMVKKFSEK
ncbi:MAG TPA: hypothetical protein VGL62_04050 [Vicinamibacterales bacterium]|jgi:hypothetical protein